MLDRPHPKFDEMKQHLSVYYHKCDKKGNYLYIEIPKQHDIEGLKKLGCSIHDVYFHYVYVNEYLWQIMSPEEDARVVSLFDVRGVTPSDFWGDVTDFIRMVSSIMGTHYPERTETMFVINSPWSFQVIWKVIKRFLDPVTLSKVYICSDNSYKEKLLEFFDPENVPKIYGGTCNCLDPLGEHIDCQFYSPTETKLRNFTHFVNYTSKYEHRELDLSS